MKLIFVLSFIYINFRHKYNLIDPSWFLGYVWDVDLNCVDNDFSTTIIIVLILDVCSSNVKLSEID